MVFFIIRICVGKGMGMVGLLPQEGVGAVEVLSFSVVLGKMVFYNHCYYGYYGVWAVEVPQLESKEGSVCKLG